MSCCVGLWLFLFFSFANGHAETHLLISSLIWRPAKAGWEEESEGSVIKVEYNWSPVS